MIFDNKEKFIHYLRSLAKNKKSFSKLSDDEIFEKQQEVFNFLVKFESLSKSRIKAASYLKDDYQLKLVLEDSEEFKVLELSAFRVACIESPTQFFEFIKGLRQFLKEIPSSSISLDKKVKIFGKIVEFLNSKGGCSLSQAHSLSDSLFKFNCEILFNSYVDSKETHPFLDPQLEFEPNYDKIIQAYSELYSLSFKHLKSNQGLGLKIRKAPSSEVIEKSHWSKISTADFSCETLLTGSTGGGALQKASWLISLISNLEFKDSTGNSKSLGEILGDIDNLKEKPFCDLDEKIQKKWRDLFEKYSGWQEPKDMLATRDIPKFRWIDNKRDCTLLIAAPSNAQLSIMHKVDQAASEAYFENESFEDSLKKALRKPFQFITHIGIVGSNPQNVSALYQELFASKGVPRFISYFKVRESPDEIVRQFVTVDKWFPKKSVLRSIASANSKFLEEHQERRSLYMRAHIKDKADHTVFIKIAKEIYSDFYHYFKIFNPKADTLDYLVATPLQKVFLNMKLSSEEFSEIVPLIKQRMSYHGYNSFSEFQFEIVRQFFESKFLKEN